MMQMMICEIDGVAPGIWMQPIGYSVLREQSNSHRSKRNQKYLTVVAVKPIHTCYPPVVVHVGI